MAHVITAVLYVLFFYANRKTLGILLIFTVLLLLGYLYEPSDDFGFFIWDAVYGRINRIFENTDLSRDYNAAFLAFKNYFLTGASYDTIKDHYPTATGETLWFVLAQNGIVGIFFYISPFIYILYSLIKTHSLTATQLKLLILFGLNFAQRPYFYYPLYFVLFYYIWFDNSSTVATISNNELKTVK
jgi:hypothetical protein